MTLIGKNIKKIRAVKKMSQTEFANLFDVSRPSVGAYEDGRAEPKIETIIKIAMHFQLSIDTLLRKELTVNELFKFNIFTDRSDLKTFEGKEKDKDDVKEQTPLVTIESMIDYIVNYQNKDFINRLPVINFPFTKTKKSRAFQIEGGHMEYGKSGFHHKDILLCCPINDFDRLEENELYVVVTNEQLIIRRFLMKQERYIFKADNPAYDSVEIHQNDIIELWKAEAVFSNTLNKPSLLEERVSRLEEELKKIQQGR